MTPSPHVSPEPEAPRAVPMSGDLPLWVAPGTGSRVVVYLHGFCGEPSRADEWARSVQPLATVVGLTGNVPCVDRPGRFRYAADVKYLDYRIRKAIRSSSAALERSLDAESIVLVGYSEGALRAEQLAWLFPRRYSRTVLMSGPSAPAYEHLARTERVAIVRGQREYSKSYRNAAGHLTRAGLAAQYFELPGAAHGEFGPDAARVVADIFDFLLAD
ncbi:MAG: alpha/beta hydrolase [Polyangiaceae bacterium]